MSPIDAEQVFLDYRNMVYKQAHTLLSVAKLKGQDFDDLVSSGNIGIMRAIKSFDDSKDVQLSTHVGNHIRWQMLRLIRDTNIGMSFPNGIKEIAHKIKRLEIEKSPIAEIAEEVKESEYSVKYALAYLVEQTPIRLDAVVTTDDGEAVIGRLHGHMDDHTEKYVEEFMESLTVDEEKLVNGLLNEQSQKEIGKMLGITQVAVSRRIANLRDKYTAYLKGLVYVAPRRGPKKKGVKP